MTLPLRADLDVADLRAAARKTKNAAQARRLLALAAVYDGASRTEAAKIGGVTLQIVRDWVLKLNAYGPNGPRPTIQIAERALRDGAPGAVDASA